MAENELTLEPTAEATEVLQTSETANPPSDHKRVLDRPLSEMMRFDWETVAWILLFVAAVVTRFYDIGVRAMSHDESLHTLYAYYLYDAGNYQHNPMMHGPLLFHANALIYSLFGHTDATARIVPALAGLGVIWMARLFRRYIGRTGALMVGLLILISPSLLFHSRYIRNDIYIALFVMIWVYAAFRYLDTQRFKWIVVMTLGMAFGFVTKENHFMNGAVIGAFFAVLAFWRLIGRGVFAVVSPVILAGVFSYYFHMSDQDMIALAVLGVGALAALGLLTFYLMRPSLGGNWRRLRLNPSADLAVVMLTLVLPFTAPFGHLVLGWDAMAHASSTDIMRSALLVGIMTLVSVIVAFYWFGMRPDEIKNGEIESNEVENEAGDLVDDEFDAVAFGENENVLQQAQDPDAPALMGFADWAIVMALFWAVQVLFFTTFFTNVSDGLATGIVGSLGYWLAQQEVARGGQPWYYYIMLGGLYEFLPILLSGTAVAAILYNLNRHINWDPVRAGDLPDDVVAEVETRPSQLVPRYLANRLYFIIFAVWWMIGTWGAYTVAGEKMPWLMTHMALTMCVLGGWLLGRLILGVNWRDAARSHAVWLLALGPALLFALGLFLGNLPDFGREIEAVAGITEWLLYAAIVLGLIYAIWALGRRFGLAGAARLLSLGFIAVLFLLTVRFSYLLTYVNYDMATEYLVYAHATPDVKRALAEIDLISERTAGERNVAVAYDDDTSWPLSWYMRQYPNAKFYGASPSSDAMASPVVIVGPKNYDAVHPYVVRDYVKRDYRLVWWPDQGYFNWTPQRMWTTLTDPDKLKDLLQIVFYRRYPGVEGESEWRDLTEWPNRHEFEMWVRRDVAADIWDLGVVPVTGGTALVGSVPEVELATLATLGGAIGDIPLNGPRTSAAGPDGQVVIADSSNHRVVVLDQDGNLVMTFGSYCDLEAGEAGGCIDPDGSGPAELGDGQFYEPWGLAVDGQGNIYVADTWNERIQVFDNEGNLLRKWGSQGATNGELGDPYILFGPRGIALDGNGNLLVADTGNKRIVIYSPEGELVDQFGGGGAIAGRFDEPTDVAVDLYDGSIYVADAWNQRVQKFNSDLSFVGEWPIPTWEGLHHPRLPYLTVANTGDLYVGDPAMYRVLVYAPDGTIKNSFGRYGAEGNQFALASGMATDPATGNILVTDGENGRVLVYPPLP